MEKDLDISQNIHLLSVQQFLLLSRKQTKTCATCAKLFLICIFALFKNKKLYYIYIYVVFVFK